MNRILRKIFLSGVLLVTPILTISITTTSCTGLSSADRHYQYIWNRSFSLSVYWKIQNHGTICISGTIWILDHKAGGGKYEYYAGTNFHVASPLFSVGNGKLIGEGITYQTVGEPTYVIWTTNSFLDTQNSLVSMDDSAWDKNLTQFVTIKQIDQYQDFWSANFKDFNPFLNDGQNNNLTDFAMIDIDFGDNVSGLVRHKLTTIKQHSIKFKQNRYENAGSTMFYTLGFPGSMSSYSIQMDSSQGKLRNYGTISSDFGFVVQDWVEQKPNDMWGSYYYMDTSFKTWHGQSGSLVIDENYNVVGLVDLGSDDRVTNISLIVLLSVGDKYDSDKMPPPNPLTYQYNYIDDFCAYANLNSDKYLVN